MRWLIGIILGEIICESLNWQHIQRLKITIFGANWQLFRLERIAKCSYFILSTQNIKFYWFVMKIKKFMLPIWWYNRGLFVSFWEWIFGVFVLNGLMDFLLLSLSTPTSYIWNGIDQRIRKPKLISLWINNCWVLAWYWYIIIYKHVPASLWLTYPVQ